MEEFLAKDPIFAPETARGFLTKNGTQDSDDEEDDKSQVNTTLPQEKEQEKQNRGLAQNLRRKE